jgi:hypothetical protein
MVEKSVFIKLLPQKIHCIPNQHCGEEQDDTKAVEDVLHVDLESVQCVDKVLRYPYMVWWVTHMQS